MRWRYPSIRHFAADSSVQILASGPGAIHAEWFPCPDSGNSVTAERADREEHHHRSSEAVKLWSRPARFQWHMSTTVCRAVARIFIRRGYASPPSSLPPPSFPFLLLPALCSPPLLPFHLPLFLPLPMIQLGDMGERCKLHPAGPSTARPTNDFWRIWSIKSSTWQKPI